MKKRVKVAEPNRLTSWMKLVFFLYLFVFAIEIIKKASLMLAPDVKDYLMQGLGPIKAVCVGWFTTAIAQSSGAVSSVTAAFTGNGLIDLPTAIYIMIGASLGTTITALVISLVVVSVKRRDFRHGVEIGLSYSIYSALLVFIVVFLEYFFGLFSKVSLFLAELLQDKISLLKVPDLVGIITGPLVDALFKLENNFFLILFGFVILIFTLRFISKAIMEVLGGEDRARRFINKYFDSKYKAYFTGVILTAIVFSSSITIGLLVPLAVSRLISLKKAIPFILGADLGTFTDLFLVALIIDQTNALAAAIAYALFAVVGAIVFLPNVEFLHKVTKYVSKSVIGISRRKALYILIAFVLIPLVVVVFF
jgi:solute carrier family 34 (sodium-dependent phosphate cotransporter)